jgi:ATP-dependent helicase/nuclease subunit A
LKSPLFGLTDDDLIALCATTDTPLWQRLRTSQKYPSVVGELEVLLSHADYVRPFELFSEVLTKFGGRQKMAQRLGAEVEDALDELMNLALQFEEEHIPDLQSFMQWLSMDEVEVKREQEQSDVDQVRVMTVHGSKGLQAPIVMLPDTVHLCKIQKGNGLLWDEQGAVYFPLNKDAYESCCLKIFEKEKQKRFDEYRRLLYVALTRAEDRLCICGYSSQKGADARSWYALCEETLKQIGISQDNGRLSFTSPQRTPVLPKESNEKEVRNVSLPDWIGQPAEAETPLSKPYMPSHAQDEDDVPAESPLKDGAGSFKRGLLIHRILQSVTLPSERVQTAEYIRLFLKVNAPDLTEAQSRQIENEILNLYDDPNLAFLFGPESYAEVPVAGEADGRIVSGRIDRLAVEKDRVCIVDFKTNRPAAAQAADVPQAYRNQLKCYKTLIEKIYPQKRVETYILWTNTLNFMRID